MTKGQQVIKVFGIVLAVVLIVLLFFGVFKTVKYVISLLPVRPVAEKTQLRTLQSDEPFEEIRIELGTGAVIRTGERFSLTTENPYLTFEVKDGVLQIKEESHSPLDFNFKSAEITLPDRLYKTAEIRVGAGTFEMELLRADRLVIAFGAGKAVLGTVKAGESCKLESGTGTVEIRNGDLQNGKLELGVGKFDFTGVLHGSTKVECGVGRVSIRLTDSLTAYTLQADRGLSSVRLNGDEMKNKQKYGAGANLIEIESGVGEVEITAEP